MFIVIEIQKNSESSISLLTDTYVNRNDAESKFYTILAAAAISSVYQHGASLLDDSGAVLRYESYSHPILESQEE